jgi:hypothetical protein
MTTRSIKSANWLDVLSASLRLGRTSFGGPIAHLGYFLDEYVVRRSVEIGSYAEHSPLPRRRFVEQERALPQHRTVISCI